MTDYLRVDRPVFAPSCCLLCTRSSDPEGFVDLGRDLNAPHPDARVYVCSRCSSQLGAAFGMVAAADAAVLRQEVVDHATEIGRLRLELAQAEGRGSWTWTPIDFAGDYFAGEYDATPGYVQITKTAAAKPETYSIGEIREDPDLVPTICPDCGGTKTATSKRCRSCSARIASEARKTGTAA